jgi:Cupin-like domain
MNNSRIHLFSKYKYAHFSYVTDPPDLNKYPLFSQARSLDFELHAGDSLYIPKNWWHWITSHGDRCTSVNFWFENSLTDTPRTKSFSLEGLDWTFPDENQEVFVWLTKTHDARYMTYKEFTEGPRDEKWYINTLKGYDRRNVNQCILELFRPQFDQLKLRCSAPSEAVPNFWINYGQGIDTGLHYDDLDGILCVLEGTKKVRLFDPGQTQYLYPHRVK